MSLFLQAAASGREHEAAGLGSSSGAEANVPNSMAGLQSHSLDQEIYSEDDCEDNDEDVSNAHSLSPSLQACCFVFAQCVVSSEPHMALVGHTPEKGPLPSHVMLVRDSEQWCDQHQAWLSKIS